MITIRITRGFLVSAALSALGCGDDGSMSKSTDGAERQTPPMGADALEAWLASGAYKDWQCEEAPHAQRAPSPHAINRICSNALIADNATGSADWPAGAAAVKELFDSPGDEEPSGYAVYLKTAPDSAGGANWYWYERVGNTTAADGLDERGCVNCHAAAGTDAAHTPSAGARDMVYTPVP
jgi:hypothetical protein